MTTRATPLLTALAMSLGCGMVSAADTMSCDQIVWPAAVLEEYPDADKACQQVILQNGKRYVQFSAKFVRADADGNVIVKVMMADGKLSQREFKAPQYLDVKSETGMTAYDFRELRAGDVLDVFIPTTLWPTETEKAAGVSHQ
jgi:hypothetical protein